MRLFVFGFGYTAAALARQLDSWAVAGTSRSAAGRAALARDAVQPIDPSEPDELAQGLAGADALLISAPPSAQGCPAFVALAPLLSERRPRWIGYLSTTGVYGDREGRWVFEDSPLQAHSVEGARRAAAEHDWRTLDASIFRLPGIYGPGRSAFDRLREGTAKRLVKPRQVFSRIHVDDLASALAASLARPERAGVFNICDDEPAPSHVVTAYAAELLGIAPPPEEPFEEAVLSPMARRFWSENKRVSNARAKAALGWRPAYATYREGLAAVLRAERT